VSEQFRARIIPGRNRSRLELFLVACLVALLGTGLCVAGACLPASALAAPSVRLRAALRPEIPGRSTTVSLSLRIAPAVGELAPPPVVEAKLRYPAGLDVQLSELGIDECRTATLELLGPQGCPPNSVMGYGSVLAALAIKGELVTEAARIAILRTTGQAGHPALLFYIYGESALSAQIVLPTEMLPAGQPYGGLLDIHVPLVPTFPEGPDVAVSELALAIGPRSLTYSERVHHKLVRYKPAGIPLPRRCPHGGFPFAIELSFLGGSHAAGRTAVPCPGRLDRRR
jgi:hypothetical protein